MLSSRNAVAEAGCAGEDVHVRTLLLGFGLGALVALQVGPMSLFLIRSTLRLGVRVGLAIGLGIALVDALYAGLGAAGAAPMLSVPVVRIVFGLAGSAVLLRLGAHALMTALRVRSGLEVTGDVANPRRALLTSLGATASNPSTILSWAAIFAAASSATHAAAVPLVVGVGLGSLCRVVVLACFIAAVRRRLGSRAIATADAVAGTGMLGFARVLGYRTLKNV